jgi:CysZ protein
LARCSITWRRGDRVGFFAGAGAFFEGVGFVVGTPRTWPRAMVPMAMALVLVGGLGVGGVIGAEAYAHHALGDGFGAGLLGVLLAAGAIVLAVVIGVSLAQPLSGWALDGLVREQDRGMGVPPAPEQPMGHAALRSLASALLAIAAGLPLIVLLTLLGWIVPPAAVVTLPLKVVVASLLLAWDLLDYPLGLRGVGIGARIGWCMRNFGAMLGFGLAAMVVFVVPGLGLLALPCGVAGAARLVARRRVTP